MNTVLELIADHPKISQSVALTTAGVSGAVQYVEKELGFSPDLLTQVGLVVSIIASAVIVYANLRRMYLETLQTKADLRIKELEAKKLQNEIAEQEAIKKKRREAGKPLRREND